MKQVLPERGLVVFLCSFRFASSLFFFEMGCFPVVHLGDIGLAGSERFFGSNCRVSLVYGCLVRFLHGREIGLDFGLFHICPLIC